MGHSITTCCVKETPGVSVNDRNAKKSLKDKRRAKSRTDSTVLDTHGSQNEKYKCTEDKSPK